MQPLSRISSLAIIGTLGATTAQAQEIEARWGARVGFHIGNEFRVGGQPKHLEGFEIGADIPLIRRVPKVGAVTFAPTLFFAGSNRKGADTDGFVGRLVINVKREIGHQGVYGGLGLGYSFAEPRGSQFTSVNGFTAQYLIGYNLPAVQGGRYQPFAEISYYDGETNHLRGWSFQFGLRF